MIDKQEEFVTIAQRLEKLAEQAAGQKQNESGRRDMMSELAEIISMLKAEGVENATSMTESSDETLISALWQEGGIYTDSRIWSALQDIMDAFPYYMMLVDSEHNLLFANRRLREDLGINPEDIIGQYCPRVIHGMDTPYPGCPLEIAAKENRVVEVEFYDQDHNTWGLSSVYPTNLKGRDGSAIYFHSFRDITARKLIESGLQESEQKFRILSEESPNMIFIIKGSRVVYVNKKCEQVMGYSREEFYDEGFDFLELIEPQFRKIVRANFDLGMKGVHVDPAEYRLITASRRQVDVLLATNSITYDKEPAMIGILTDITERNLAEHALRESEERYRLLVELSPNGVAIHSEGKLVFINSAGARLLGAESPDELLGKPVMDIVDPEYREMVGERFRQMVRSGTGAPLAEEKFIKLDGTPIDVEVASMPFTYQGKQAFQVIVHDISKRLQTTRELQESLDKLKRSMEGTINSMALVVETRDVYTAGHQQRVSKLASSIAKEMGLGPEQVEGVRIAGLLHDIGKISVPAEILSKPSSINQGEYNLVKIHPAASYEILKEIEFTQPIADIVLQHHERINGSGYPSGLSSDQIMVEAKILAVADVIEAMSARRPYRSPLGIDAALAEISDNKGILYDSEVVDACLRMFAKRRLAVEEMLLGIT